MSKEKNPTEVISRNDSLIEQIQSGAIGDDLSNEKVVLEEPGSFIMGRLLVKKYVTNEQTPNGFGVYTFKTATGRKVTVLGQQADDVLREDSMIGRILYIEYLGTVSIGHGRKMNQYKIIDVTEEAGRTGIYN